MKLIFVNTLMASMFSLGIGNISSALGDELPKNFNFRNEVPLAVEHIFIPGGFDNNDVTEVVVKGTLDNTCWKAGNASASYDETRNFIHVKVMGYKLEGVACLPMTSVFVQSVRLGQLPAGTYTVAADKGPADRDIEKQFIVHPANSASQDEHLYAQVDSVHLLKSKQFSVGIEIQGRIPASNGECLKVSDLEVRFDADDVLTVLPILAKGQTTDCTEEELINGRPFFRRFYQYEHPASFLIHVRSINGQSVNRFVPAN